VITVVDERAKYNHVWTKVPSYRATSPGLRLVPHFLKRIQPPGTLIDLGCGPGRAGKELAAAGFDVTLFDLSPVSVDAGNALQFIEGNLWEMPPLGTFDYFYCTDVMEHIPPEYVERVFDNIAELTDKGGFFQIAMFGHIVDGYVMHLSVHPREFWAEQINQRWRNNEFVEIESQRLCAFVGAPR
jgi:2-polyprenyl-3-methyl-5-hydroxy-6-metoxy-1,4-benzoquinol methylase